MLKAFTQPSLKHTGEPAIQGMVGDKIVEAEAIALQLDLLASGVLDKCYCFMSFCRFL